MPTLLRELEDQHLIVPAEQERPLVCASGMVRRVNREIIVLLGWTPAILLQFAHPLVAAGVANHSTFRAGLAEQARRTQHTIGAMLAMTFGDRAAGERAVARINAIHDHVHGYTSTASGPFPAGTGYCAHDPALLLWVYATLHYCTLRAYRWYVGPLSRAELDRYCWQARAGSAALGLDEAALPRDYAALRAYLASMLASGQIVVTPTARRLAQVLLHPPVPAVCEPLLAALRLPAAGFLPLAIRAGYGFTWGPGHARALARSGRAVRALLPLVPETLRCWPES